MTNNIKLYLVKFTNKQKYEYFYKFGLTHHYDVLKRFDDPQYEPWDIKVMASAYGPRELVEKAEKELLNRYPKNLWIEQKISGVTEIVSMNKLEVVKAINMINQYSKDWYVMRQFESSTND